jgi:hypothetical protein
MFITKNTKTFFSNIHFSTVLTSKSMSPNGFLPFTCSVHKLNKLKSLEGCHDDQCLSSPLSHLWNHSRYLSIIWYNGSMLKSVPQIVFWLSWFTILCTLHEAKIFITFLTKYPDMKQVHLANPRLFGMYGEWVVPPTSTCWLHEKNSYRNQNISTLQFSPFSSIF